jgi:16S rRNA (cytidine1402-2'-O)-methyltransferase
MLYLVATPIGDINEISKRALDILTRCENIICESTKEASTFLKAHNITQRKFHLLNEHSQASDLTPLVTLCEQYDVALVSDSGTPGFCDPGADLVAMCRRKKIPIHSVLGCSALMGLLSLSSVKLNQFVFVGFLAAENEKRKTELRNLQKENRAMVLMDTPYRQMKLLAEISETLPQRRLLLTQNLSQEIEMTFEGFASEILEQIHMQLAPQIKAEFMILVYPADKL